MRKRLLHHSSYISRHFLYRYADTPKELQDKYIEACTNLTVAGGLGKLSFGPSVQPGSGLIK